MRVCDPSEGRAGAIHPSRLAETAPHASSACSLQDEGESIIKTGS